MLDIGYSLWTMKKIIICILTLGILICGVLFWLLLCHAQGARVAAAEGTPTRGISKETWDSLAGQRLFFGHQSVGEDIVAGISDVARQHDVDLTIIEGTNSTVLGEPAFAHARMGDNLAPESKLKAFREAMDGGLGNKADIAFLKLCYVDFRVGDDPTALFTTYRETLDALQLSYPETTFIHMAVPVCGRPGGLKNAIKAPVKALLGREGETRHNAVRHEFNRLLRDAYAPEGRFFDLAAAESVGPDGMRYVRRSHGEEFPMLAPGNTDDGGHLNATGRKRVAEQILAWLAETAQSRPKAR